MFFDLKNNRAIWQITMFLSCIVIVLSFQNCGSAKNFSGETSTENPSSCDPEVQNCNNSCEFDGDVIPDQGYVFAFVNSTVPYSESCTYEKRTCRNGELSGSFAYAHCEAGGPAACLFDGRTVPHGESVEAYVSSSAPFGSNCVKETRTCLDGNLSGSYDYAKCDVGAPASCLFNGNTVPHNIAVTAYAASTVPFGSSCSSQARKCNNGVLSGSYTFANCDVGAPAACMFNGQTIAHGMDVKAYATSTVPFGSSCSLQTRTCNNGSLSGSYTFANCNVNAPAACMFNGQTVAHNASIPAYQTSSVPAGQSCAQQDRLCTNGSLSGSYTHSTCVAEGLISTNVTVKISCSISAAASQTLKVTLKNGTTKSWSLGNGEKSVTPFNEVFSSAPVAFEAYANGVKSSHKYSNQTATTLRFSSEDGHDGDYNDLVCSFSW